MPRIRGTRAVGDCPVGDLALFAIFQLRIYFSLFHLIHRFKHLQSGKISQLGTWALHPQELCTHSSHVPSTGEENPPLAPSPWI